jgi:hypothetical protein
MLAALRTLDGMVAAALAEEPMPTGARVRELISAVRKLPMCQEVDDEAAELLARRFEARLDVRMTLGTVLTDDEFKPWLDTARASIEPYYWDRYRRLLVEQGFSNGVISAVDSVTDRILGLLQDPNKTGTWDRRGMVVGHVQSGKTANYTGLICKAADAGYKLIVVIAGIHNNLRNQTQQRIDEGFVGRDSARLLSRRDQRLVGVGRFDQRRRPVTFTNSLRDFNKVMATGLGVPLKNLNEPAVFVIKKNTSTLRNLLEWLREHSAGRGSSTVDEPMLLIDDEADNASINIRHGKGGVSRINGQLRDLLKMFDRSCYIGYTATPFANIFIDPDSDDEMLGEDLFPRNFIVSLDPPSDYFGPTRVFLEEGEAFVRPIDDNEDVLPVRHKIDHPLVVLPPSLIRAVRAFVVARAIRLSRGQEGRHHSMLVNASRFTLLQRRLRDEVHLCLEAIQASARVYGALPVTEALRDPEISSIHRVWSEEYSASASWDDVQRSLHPAAAAISVVEVNSRSSGTLNYSEHADTGLSIIAVGGYSLSRGLTLEGLMVSYFLRSSVMYDTLMQMGRWFGYRTGYDDLCRIWMPEEAEGWYAHIAESIEMLRDELRSMEAAAATPEDFGLKVRSHPDALLVTARNKMGSGEQIVVRVGLGNNFVETSILKRDDRSLSSNRLAVDNLVARLAEHDRPIGEADGVPTGWLVRKAPVETVYRFLGEFQNHEGSMLTSSEPIRRYIDERRLTELADWDILFASIGRTDADTLRHETLGVPINCQRRTAGIRSTESTLHVSNKRRVSSRGVEKTGLVDHEIEVAEAAFRQLREMEGKPIEVGKSINYPDRVYRAVRNRPLLIVHLLNIDDKNDDPTEHVDPVVAWSISFPKTVTPEQRVEFIVNPTWLRENYGDGLEEEELGGDDE